MVDKQSRIPKYHIDSKFHIAVDPPDGGCRLLSKKMSAPHEIDEVGYPAPLRLVADRPHEIRWANSPISTVFSFPWKPLCPSSSDDDRHNQQLADYYEDPASSSEQSLSSRRDPADKDNITLQCLLDYCAKIGVQASSNRVPESSGRDISDLVKQYVDLKGRKNIGPNEALAAARESRALATKICKRLQSINNRNMSNYFARKAVITDDLARLIYMDTVPSEYKAARDLSNYLETGNRRPVLV